MGINEPILKDINKKNKQLEKLKIYSFLKKLFTIKDKFDTNIILGNKTKKHFKNWLKLINPTLKEFKTNAETVNWKRPIIIENNNWDIKYSMVVIGNEFIKLLLYIFFIQLKFNKYTVNKTETNKIPEHTQIE